jgi:DNA-binding XRE family transcriptional regulator
VIDERRLYQLLGERIRKLREGREAPGGRMTQADLAALVDLERTSITNIEKGVQKLSLHVLYKICGVLDANVLDILPRPAEVAQEQALPLMTELEFAGKTYVAPQKTLQKIAAILDMGEPR